MRIEFEWDPAKEELNARKHGVSLDAAMPVFDDPLARPVLDTDHRADRAIVRIISARRPTRKEARQYREDK